MKNCSICNVPDERLSIAWIIGSPAWPMFFTCDKCGRDVCENCCAPPPDCATGFFPEEFKWDMMICTECRKSAEERCARAWDKEYGENATFPNPYREEPRKDWE